jgi:hypothetical protein
MVHYNSFPPSLSFSSNISFQLGLLGTSKLFKNFTIWWWQK